MGTPSLKEFSSVGALAEYLESRMSAVEAALREGVRQGGELIQHEAKSEIGHYQAAAGPFPEWAPLAEATLDGYTTANGRHFPGKVDFGFSPPDNPLLRTGELRDAIGMVHDDRHAVVGVPDRTVGTGTPEDPIRNVGDVAFWHEFGTDKMPPRSFLGRAAFLKGKEAAHLIGRALIVSLFGGTPMKSP